VLPAGPWHPRTLASHAAARVIHGLPCGDFSKLVVMSSWQLWRLLTPWRHLQRIDLLALVRGLQNWGRLSCCPPVPFGERQSVRKKEQDSAEVILRILIGSFTCLPDDLRRLSQTMRIQQQAAAWGQTYVT